MLYPMQDLNVNKLSMRDLVGYFFALNCCVFQPIIHLKLKAFRIMINLR